MAYGQLAPLPIMVNGINYSWGNLVCALFKTPITQVTKISWKRKQAMENNYGQGNEPISRGFGKVEYEGSIEFYQDLWLQIKAAAPNGDPFQFDPFDFTMVLGGTRVAPKKITLKFMQFMEDGLDVSQGDTSIKITVPFIFSAVI